MSLIQEINRTETEKNKTKIVATNIDNKLVELGGEQATDLADVPNKMGTMIKDNYKKVAKIKYKFKLKLGVTTIKVPLNLSFNPSMLFIKSEKEVSWQDNINKGTVEERTNDGQWSSHLQYTYKSHTAEYLLLKVLKHTEVPPDHREYGVDIICVE